MLKYDVCPSNGLLKKGGVTREMEQNVNIVKPR